MLPVSDTSDKLKRTNEIKTVEPLLKPLDIEGKNITGDALLTQRNIVKNIVEDKQANYFLTVKENQPTLYDDIKYYFDNTNSDYEFGTIDPPDHGRIETRKIRTTTELNGYLTFPHIGQVYEIERERIEKRTGKISKEIVYGITNTSPKEVPPKKILEINRHHWGVENSCHYILDWNYNEDRCRIRTGNGPENVSRLRKFAISLFKSKGIVNVSEKIRMASFSKRIVFDYLKMTKNSQPKNK